MAVNPSPPPLLPMLLGTDEEEEIIAVVCESVRPAAEDDEIVTPG